MGTHGISVGVASGQGGALSRSDRMVSNLRMRHVGGGGDEGSSQEELPETLCFLKCLVARHLTTDSNWFGENRSKHRGKGA